MNIETMLYKCLGYSFWRTHDLPQIYLDFSKAYDGIGISKQFSVKKMSSYEQGKNVHTQESKSGSNTVLHHMQPLETIHLFKNIMFF